MTYKELIDYMAGWDGKGSFATVKVDNTFNVIYFTRSKPQYIPFFLRPKQKIHFTRFQ